MKLTQKERELKDYLEIKYSECHINPILPFNPEDFDERELRKMVQKHFSLGSWNIVPELLLYLDHLQGKSYQKICEEQGMGKTTVSDWCHRGKKYFEEIYPLLLNIHLWVLVNHFKKLRKKKNEPKTEERAVAEASEPINEGGNS